MKKNKEKRKAKAPAEGPPAEFAFRVVALVSADDRGQMVLPKDVRQRAGILPGERLALLECTKSTEVRCLMLMKAERLDPMLREALGSVGAAILG